MKRATTLPICAAIVVAVFLVATPGALAEPGDVKLVLWITVDQLRGDMLPRFERRFGEEGFRHLLAHGLHYANAHYGHASTFTAVGHATLFTGGDAARHGLPGNDWIDPHTGEIVYCVEDERHHLVGADPKSMAGTSPRNLTSSTIGDELALATGGRSRVFSVSLKDRGAILPAGRLGKAFWYHPATGRFVSSSFYYSELPGWARDWNDAGPLEPYSGETWTLLEPRERYVYRDADDRPFERERGTLGRVFPHPLPEDERLAGTLRATPFGDVLTLDFVKALFEGERLGRGLGVDLLAISFSSTDYVGHAFGPNSLEYEDNLLRLDRTLADLLSFVKEKVGLERSFVVLSSDHGVDAVPEHRQALGFEAPRLDPKAMIARTEKTLRARFGHREERLLLGFRNVCLYLDPAAVARAGLDRQAVARAVAEEFAREEGIALAIPREALLRATAPAGSLEAKLRRSFHPHRSGDVFVVQEPFAMFSPRPDANAAMHGSAYAYDTHVPVLFAGPRITARTVHRRIDVVDVAATVASYLGVEPPSASIGDPLPEVFQER